MGNSVRAKFHCQSVTVFDTGTKSYSFMAAYGDDNKSWAKYTPAGQLNITIDNPAAQIFTQGEDYYLDFSAAE